MHCLISKTENYCLISASSLLWRESVLQVSLLFCYFAHALFVHMLHDYYSLYVVYAMFYENKFIVIVIGIAITGIILPTKASSFFLKLTCRHVNSRHIF